VLQPEQDGVTGGRIYDAHIAAIARATGASVIVTDNRRHFVSALRHGIRVHTAAEFATAVRSQKP
jgi:predicted nucleic acid-binding protein